MALKLIVFFLLFLLALHVPGPVSAATPPISAVPQAQQLGMFIVAPALALPAIAALRKTRLAVYLLLCRLAPSPPLPILSKFACQILWVSPLSLPLPMLILKLELTAPQVHYLPQEEQEQLLRRPPVTGFPMAWYFIWSRPAQPMY